MVKKLNTVLDERNKEVEASKARIDEFMRTIKDKDKLIAAIKKERELMRKKNAQYEEQIDQLLLENKELTAKKAQLEEELTVVSKDRDNFKNKAEIGAKLKAEYVQIKALRDRMMSDGMKETGMAKRTKRPLLNSIMQCRMSFLQLQKTCQISLPMERLLRQFRCCQWLY